MRCAIIPMVLGVAGLAAIAWAALASPSPRLIYNASSSVPIGWYVITSPVAPHVGGIVLVHLPNAAATLAADRGYLPVNVPLIKRIGAIAPETVCIHGHVVSVDGISVASTLSADGSGRPLTAWPHCRRLRAGELFLLSTTNPASFDSRYFGPITDANVIGQAHPLWTSSSR